MQEPLVGTQVDQYLIAEFIASGGMADVYRAEDTLLQRPVALKIMLPELARQPELVSRFYREARAVARLDHPNIVKIYSIGELTTTAQPYLAMQYLSGGSLLQRLQQLGVRAEQMTPVQALALLHPMAMALAEAHGQGIVHRDIKPSNILLRRDGTPILTDLGIAAVKTATTRLTRTGTVLGTPHYMSPEQARGTDVDGRSDIYSLGIILYEMLAGTVPFDADNSLAILHQHLYEPPPPLAELRPELARATYQVAEICLQKEPDHRFATAEHLAQALAEARAAEESGQRRVGLTVPPATAFSPDGDRPRSRRLYALGAAGAALVLTLLTLLFWPRADGPPVVAGGATRTPSGLMVPTAPAGEEAGTPLPTMVLPDAPLPTFTPPSSATASAAATGTSSPTPSPTGTPSPVPPPRGLPQPADVPPSGTIAFTCYINGFDDICRVAATGGNITQLTAAEATDFYPSLSLANGRIYFSSRRDGTFLVYSMALDGSGVQRLNSNLGSYFAPAVSPDGQTLAAAVANSEGQDIWLMNLDGSGARRLTEDSGNNVDPVWSPDGMQIAFASDRDGAEEGDLAHYIMNADGSDVRKLETGLSELGGRSDWSADGQWLAFYAGPRDDRNIYLAATDGSVVYQLTDGGSNLAPSFSPDGNWISFTSYRDGDAEIFIMKSDGSGVTQLTFNDRPDWQPRWGR